MKTTTHDRWRIATGNQTFDATWLMRHRCSLVMLSYVRHKTFLCWVYKNITICVKRVSYSVNVKNTSCTHHVLLLSNTATLSSCFALILRPQLPSLFLQPLKVTLNNKPKSRRNVLPQSTYSAVFLLRTG